MRTGEDGWMNAQKQEVKTVQNADFCSKKTRKDRCFWMKSEHAREKGAAREADRALSGNGWEKTIFQVEKNHFS